MRQFTLALLASVILVSSGCSQLYTDYGESKGISGRTSLNGFGALRSAFEQAGFRTRDVSRLSNRVRRTDVIVWTPKTVDSVDDRVTRWFEAWLRQGDRTLVFVIPDSGSEVDYWMEAAKLAPPEQRLEYRKRAARSINERIEWRLNRPNISSNGWFQVEPLEERRIVSELTGPWQADLEVPDETIATEDAAQEDVASDEVELASLEFSLVPYDSEAVVATNTKPTPIVGATGPGTPAWIMPTTSTPTKTPIEFVPLLSDDADNTVVGEIRSDQWRGSRILVVAAGSLLTNYAFSRDPNRRLADKIIADSKPAENPEPLTGFLSSDGGTVPVSEREPNAPQVTGMEMLTEWPISIVTMHGAVLGMIFCLMLLPIFGRPKKIRRTEDNNFRTSSRCGGRTDEAGWRRKLCEGTNQRLHEADAR